MTFYHHTLTRTDTDTLTGFYADNLEGAQALYLDLVALLQTLQNDGKHLRSKLVSITLLQSALLHQYLGNLLYRQFSHDYCPPFILSFQVWLGRKFNTSFGGTSMR